MKKQSLYIVHSDNHNGDLLTPEAYKALTLQMSTGDHATHRSCLIKKAVQENEIYTLKDINPNAWIAQCLKQYNDDELRFIEEYSFDSRMSGGGIDSWNNYSGNELTGELILISKSRDAGLLEESNYESIQVHLDEKNLPYEEHCFGHWACGHIDSIHVHVENAESVREAIKIRKALDYYPCFDDSDYSERQCERYTEFAEESKTDLAEALSTHFDIDLEENKDALESAAYHLNYSYQHYSGEDSSVSIYRSREPEEYDLRALKDAIEETISSYFYNDIEYSDEREILEYLYACIGEGDLK